MENTKWATEKGSVYIPLF